MWVSRNNLYVFLYTVIRFNESGKIFIIKFKFQWGNLYISKFIYFVGKFITKLRKTKCVQ